MATASPPHSRCTDPGNYTQLEAVAKLGYVKGKDQTPASKDEADNAENWALSLLSGLSSLKRADLQGTSA